MTSSILAVFDDLELGREVKKALMKDFNGPGDSVVKLARNLMEAKGALAVKGLSFKIVVTDLLIAESSETSRDEEGRHALALLKEVNQRNDHPHGILVVPAGMPLQRRRSIQDALKEIPNCYQLERSVVEDAKDFAEGVSKWCHSLGATTSGGEQPRKGGNQPRYLEIVIDLRNENEVPQYRLEGKGFPFRWESKINIPTDSLSLSDLTENLILLSQSVPGKNWQRHLTMISKYLDKWLFDREFEQQLEKGISEVGGNLSHTNLCFLVKHKNHPILLEALRYDNNTDYWMLQAPVYRRIPARTDRYPVFGGNDREDALAPRNWLFIHSQVEGEVRDILVDGERRLRLRKLYNLDTECKQIGALLEEQLKGQEAKVEILKHEGSENFWEKVEQKLGSGTWDVIHYAGHTYFDEKKKK